MNNWLTFLVSAVIRFFVLTKKNKMLPGAPGSVVQYYIWFGGWSQSLSCSEVKHHPVSLVHLL